MGTFQTGVTFQKGILTNGAALPGEDFISGLIFYNSSPPSLFPVSLYKQCFSPQDAVNVGVDNTHVGETKAAGTYLVTNAGAAGDTVSIYSQEPIDPVSALVNPNKVLLCAYTVLSTDTTATLLGASIAAAINLLTYIHGYTATAATGTVTITFRPGLGVFPNTGTPISVVIVGAVAGTLTQPTGSGGTVLGVASVFDVYYYHVSEFFRMTPNGQLWLGIYPVPTTYNFAEVQTLQQATNGKLRQVGVFTPARTTVTNSAADLVALNAICQICETNKMPLSGVLSQNLKAVTDLSTLPNNSGLNSPWASSIVSQDGNAAGFALFKAYGITVGNIGNVLGTISVARVSACIGNPIPAFNISNAVENEVPAFGNGTLFNAVSPGLQTQLDSYRYIYTGKYTGYVGTYFNNSHCAIIQNSNYAYIEQNRVQAKIERLLYPAYLPILNSELSLNANGTLPDILIGSLESVGDQALNVMIRAGELSGVETVINPLQNITTQGGLVVTLYEQNNPIARTIKIITNSVTTLP